MPIVTVIRVGLVFLGLGLALSLPLRRAEAGNDEAREHLDKATAAFALNRYDVAAENFEKAFELKPDPAVLYNAAQSYRLAGNKERALALYQSYLRTYGKKDKRAEIESRIEELKQAIEHDKTVATSPPVTTEPTGVGQIETAPPAPTTTAVPPTTSPNLAVMSDPAATPPNLVETPATASPDNRSVVQKPWFWVAVGGGVAAVVVVVLLLAAGGSQNPSASLGKASGN